MIRQRLIKDLESISKRCAKKGWVDLNGSRKNAAVKISTVEDCLAIVDGLPDGIEDPVILPHSGGQISLGWYSGNVLLLYDKEDGFLTLVAMEDDDKGKLIRGSEVRERWKPGEPLPEYIVVELMCTLGFDPAVGMGDDLTGAEGVTVKPPAEGAVAFDRIIFGGDQ